MVAHEIGHTCVATVPPDAILGLMVFESCENPDPVYWTAPRASAYFCRNEPHFPLPLDPRRNTDRDGAAACHRLRPPPGRDGAAEQSQIAFTSRLAPALPPRHPATLHPAP